MANEITKVTDQNGVDHPFKDVAAFPRSEQAVLGAKNLAPWTLANLKASNTTGTWNNNVYTESGVTFTVNLDSYGGVESVETSGTASANIYFNINYHFVMPAFKDYIGKKLKLNGCTGGVVAQTYWIGFFSATGDGIGVNTGDGEAEFTLADYSNFTNKPQIRVVVYNGVNVTDKVFKPMVRLATDTDPTYATPAMTNKELTEKAQGIIDAATNAADFAAFKTAIAAL